MKMKAGGQKMGLLHKLAHLVISNRLSESWLGIPDGLAYVCAGGR